jgi:hypothetical protein
MSFDLKILNGDIVIGVNKDLQKVENTEKLVQDVLKILMTPIGANVFFPFYGSPLSSSIIGTSLDMQFLTSIAQNQIRTGLETLQNMQKEQSSRQRVTPDELLAAVKEVNLLRNQVDPTFFTLYLSLIAKSLRTVNTSFDVTL